MIQSVEFPNSRPQHYVNDTGETGVLSNCKRAIYGAVVVPWCSGYHYCSRGYHYRTSSFNKSLNQVLCTFKYCSRSIGDLSWWDTLTMVPARKMIQRHLLVNNYAKTIFYNHHKKLFKKEVESFFTLVKVDASIIWSCSSSNIFHFFSWQLVWDLCWSFVVVYFLGPTQLFI